MALKVKVRKPGKKLEKLINGIKLLNNEGVEAGHFSDQGVHYSGYTYPELMALHNNPIMHGYDFPPRPVLDILFNRNIDLNNPRIKRVLSKYRKLEPNETNNRFLLQEIGRYLAREEKKIFGSSDLAPNADYTVQKKGKNSPLIDSGDLKRKVAYRTTKDKAIKEGR